MEVSKENYEHCLRITQDIDAKFRKVKKDTAMFSTHSHVFEHPQFAELVAYGDKIVAYIFHRITHNGGDWVYFLLLRQVTKSNPVPKEKMGSFIHNLIFWLQWFVESDYYKKDDVYYGLINHPA